ncbi:RNA polymerase sigma factor [Terriglobus roseus]|uniref:RNA polymerase sigma-70 factor, ECF subfamily n=1 Tax=Terriglobus roseus TaxID=392734 RepID=A0A1G7GAK8_9BACT|nr:sigma-70 family RNA polymerase sigma factor [Terriglobus roseus]SDE85137.1 RNA polymerase sigma-70 factor, ECF subfamily [Terriglobus roseus]
MIAQAMEIPRLELHIQPTCEAFDSDGSTLPNFQHDFIHGDEKRLLDQSLSGSSACYQHLVDSARSGCPMAFGELWDIHSKRLYLTILRIVRNPFDAEDALQDSFILAFSAVRRFEGRSSFHTWLTRIAINSALGMLRRRRRRPEMSLEAMSSPEDDRWSEGFRDIAPGPEQLLDRKQQHATLMHDVDQLPTRLQDVVQTLLIEDCTVREAACRLNISYAAAKSRLYRARVMMHATNM